MIALSCKLRNGAGNSRYCFRRLLRLFCLCLHTKPRITLAVASLSLGAQLSSCNLLHFSLTNRIAEQACLRHYIYIHIHAFIQEYEAAIPCTRVPIKDATREHPPQPIYQRMKNDIQTPSKLLALIF